MCGGNDPSEEICGNTVTVFVCQVDPNDDDDGDTAISGKKEEAFVCEASGKLSGVVRKGVCSVRT